MRLVRLLLAALWAGTLAAVGGLVAPTLFALVDRALAGRIAGVLFTRVSWLSFALALVLAVLPAPRAQRLVVLLPAVCLALSEFGVRPELEAIRATAGAGSPAFLAWHGVSAALYALAGLGVLWVLVREARAPR